MQLASRVVTMLPRARWVTESPKGNSGKSAGCARKAGPKFSAGSVPGGAQQALPPLRSPCGLWQGVEAVKALPETFPAALRRPGCREELFPQPPARMQAGC